MAQSLKSFYLFIFKFDVWLIYNVVLILLYSKVIQLYIHTHTHRKMENESRSVVSDSL